jgi:hypothetical protein
LDRQLVDVSTQTEDADTTLTEIEPLPIDKKTFNKKRNFIGEEVVNKKKRRSN